MRTRLLLLTALTLVTAWQVPAQRGEENPSPEMLLQRGEAALQGQDWKEAALAFRALTSAQPKNARAWMLLGYALHAGRDLDQALEAHHKAAAFPATKPTATYNIACVYALKKDKDQALAWLKKAADAGFRNVDHIDGDSDMDGLRDDPRFKELVAAIADMPAPAAAVTVYAGKPERASASLFLWGGRGPAGDVLISYGLPVWKDEHEKVVEQSQGQRWRLGKDFWTTCENSVPLQFGSQVVPPGHYYLTLERANDDSFVLAFNDAAPIRQKKLVAYLADKTEGGIEVPMTHERTETVEKRLRIDLQSDGEPAGKLVIAFGPHRVSAPFQVKL